MRGINILAGVLLVLSSVVASSQVPGKVSVTGQERGWLGIYVVDDSSGYPILQSVEPGSPAQDAGLAAGDTIVGFNGNDARFKYQKLLEAVKPGERLVLRVRKNGLRTLTVTAASRTALEFSLGFGDTTRMFLPDFPSVKSSQNVAPPAPARPKEGSKEGTTKVTIPTILFPLQMLRFQLNRDPSVTVHGRYVVAGAEVADLNPDLAGALRFDATMKGLLVLNVSSGSPAKVSGLKSGDVIVKAEDIVAATVQALLQAILNNVNDRAVALEVVRQGKIEKRTLRW